MLMKQAAAAPTGNFAALRNSLLLTIEALTREQDRAELAVVKERMGLADRAFGELLSACQCRGDFAHSPPGILRLSPSARPASRC
jgi:hypothetical protein